ncbi:hypothetical protein, conserved [Angomonas deanei]|uniref:Uncharacterized protein n=1 Tax=Angomonas deanei TaxID=59799 RepID=A0A7G2CET1_9TRYP|nr:hypothetical protein, conserved [Angomonas deanei]
MDFEDFEIDWLLVGVIGLVVFIFVAVKMWAKKYGFEKGQDLDYQKHLLGQALGTISPYEEYKPKNKPQEPAKTDSKPAALEDKGDDTNAPRGRRARKED